MNNDKGKRPYVILVNLTYRGKKQTFAVPLRSNISSYVPEHTRYVLPRRHKTREGHLHGLHYIKLVPAHNKLLENVQMTHNSELYLSIINKNINQIEKELQNIINNYEKGMREDYCTDLDKLFEVYDIELEKAKSFDKLKISIKKGITKTKFLHIQNLSKINPINYVDIKNSELSHYTIEDGDIETHKKLVITACDKYNQTKSISINIFIYESITMINHELQKVQL